jgi:xanthine dehydrogenase YagS FAD-binding subunit
MNPFEFHRASDQKSALKLKASAEASKFIAGGTNLIDLMKKNVERPSRLVDINNLPLKYLRSTAKGVEIGALMLNSEIAEHNLITTQFPLLSLALKAGASPQLRNMATAGGNLLQRTRCPYFYDTVYPCNKREPGSGCSALEGYNRMHAIFGHSPFCIAVHPSDMAVALAALDATVIVDGKDGKRSIHILDFHRLPEMQPQFDNNLRNHELITAIHLPTSNYNKHVHYLKIRDRASYAFALVSVAAALEIVSGEIRSVRLAMGGVAHKPWRLKDAEYFLRGKRAAQENFQAAAEIVMANAKPFEHNRFKVRMGKNAIIEALTIASTTA